MLIITSLKTPLVKDLYGAGLEKYQSLEGFPQPRDKLIPYCAWKEALWLHCLRGQCSLQIASATARADTAGKVKLHIFHANEQCKLLTLQQGYVQHSVLGNQEELCLSQ